MPRSVRSPLGNEPAIKRWRRGRIWMIDGKLACIQRRRPGIGISVAQVWLQGKFGRPAGDICRLDYHQPFRMRGVLVLNYVLSGDRATYRTFIGAIHMLQHIARIRGAVAIVAHVTNAEISDRLLTRHGWDRHLENKPGRHYIRRFYEGYPDMPIQRYLVRQEGDVERD